MEVKKTLQKKLMEQKGSTLYIFIILLVILMTVFLCVVEYYRVMELHDMVTTEMDRASNMAVEYSMIDDAREYHLSKIDADIANEQFDTFFTERLNLNNNFEKFVDGKRYYKVVFSTFNIDAEIPKIHMQGTLYIDLQLVSNYVTVPIELPFNITSRNVNVED